MALATGKRLGHYEILGPLGAGGMGEVYRARDTRLGREVAIKIVPERLARDPHALARFEREAKTLAGLSHPNILTIHDFGTDEELSYAVTELLQGESLRQRISKTPLPWNKVLEIGIAIADGLAAAHTSGVIHRDLKPENIFLTNSGGVKILDFGLARLQASSSDSGKSELPTLGTTEPGTVLGTLGYMSPEQLRGLPMDARTDIFSFGCVLYEMATRVSPFSRNTAADTMAAVLNSDPPLLTQSGRDVPPELDRVIMHCLEKNEEDRFQSSRDLAFDLREIGSGARLSRPLPAFKAQPTLFRFLLAAAVAVFVIGAVFFYFRFFANRNSTERIPIAVADFVNETGEKDLNGLSGMLITSLEQSRKLSVLTRSRMFDILKQIGKTNVEHIDEDVGREICRQANVNALVLASIRKFDQLYTIDLKILDTSKNEYIFTAKEQGTGKSNVPSMIDKLSEVTRAGLKEKASEIQHTSMKVADVTTTNLEAYQHYFLGEQYINKLKFSDAQEEFSKAIALDPSFALAYYRLSYAAGWENLSKAAEPGQKAMRYMNKLPPKEQLMLKAAEAFGSERDVTKAISIARQVVASYPGEKEPLFWIGDWSYHSGDYETAKIYFEKVLALDPNFERALQHMIWNCLAMDQQQKAVEYAKLYVSRTPNENSYRWLINSYLSVRDLAGAERALQRMVELFPDAPDTIEQQADLLILKEDYAAAEQQMRRLIMPDRIPLEQLEGYELLFWHLIYRGKLGAALEANRHKLELAQEYAPARVADGYAEQAYTLFLQGKREEAKAVIEKSLANATFGGEMRDVFEALLLLGEYQHARSVVQSELRSHAPFLDQVVSAYQDVSLGEYRQAIAKLEPAARKGAIIDRIIRRYDIAQCYLSLKQWEKAIETIQWLNALPGAQLFDFYPKTLYLSGKAYQETGDKKSAAVNYRKFLKIWSDADPELPELQDAKQRLKSLEGES